jgi:hypothetical protein
MVLSVAAESKRCPHFDQLTLVIGAPESLSYNSLATPLVSKSQITHVPSVHPAAHIFIKTNPEITLCHSCRVLPPKPGKIMYVFANRYPAALEQTNYTLLET